MQVAQSATLIYNGSAGGAQEHSPEELLSLLEQAGYRPQYQPTEAPEDLDPILAGAGDGLVVAAGGDGTFREVAKRAVAHSLAVTLVPLGTANNIAHSLGIQGRPEKLIPGLERPDRVRLDLARARGPWGEEIFVEGAGLGLFANILAAYRPEEGKSVLRAVGVAALELGEAAPVRCRAELDGRDITGELLLLEVMNTRAVGPRLAFAPDADPTDGLLDVVRVSYADRQDLLSYLSGLLTNGLQELPSVEVLRGRELDLHWRGSAFHADAVTLCADGPEGDRSYSARVDVLPQALEFWRPKGD